MKNKLLYILFLLASGISLLSVACADPAVLEIGSELDDKGVFITRADGNQVNLRIVDNNFQLYFLDASKKLVEPDAVKAIIRYSSHVKKTDRKRSLVLTPESGGLYFTASRSILHPHYYRVKVLLKFEDASVSEYLPEKRLNQLGTSS